VGRLRSSFSRPSIPSAGRSRSTPEGWAAATGKRGETVADSLSTHLPGHVVGCPCAFFRAQACCKGASHVAGGRKVLDDIRLAAVSLDSAYPGIDVPRFRPYAEHVAVSCTRPGKVYLDAQKPLRMRRVVSPPLTALRATPRWRASDSSSILVGGCPPLPTLPRRACARMERTVGAHADKIGD
jgi:hypothetical protein